MPYVIALPTYAATAWYHHMLPSQPQQLQPFLKEVEQFAMGPYADALAQGANLPQQDFNAIAQKLHAYTGLPVAYIKKANLRVSGGQFEQTLLGSSDETTGRLDSRFAGPTMDPLSRVCGVRPAGGCDQLGLHRGLQRLRAPRSALPHERELPAGDRRVPLVGVPPSAARVRPSPCQDRST